MAESRFRKGDLVAFQFGIYPVRGVVKEDRGPLGIKGRHLYLVEFPFGDEPDSPSLVELPPEEMQLVRARVSTD